METRRGFHATPTMKESGMLDAEVEVVEGGSSWWGVVTGRYANGELRIVPASGGWPVVRPAHTVTLIGD